MKCVVIAIAALLVLSLSSPAQIQTGAAPSKPTPSTGSSTTPWRIEGDTVEECWVIESLPFTDAGNSCEFADDYEEMCPYGSNSPDVVYSYTPAEDMCVSISLCNSYYDTKMFVYEDEVVGGVPYACNDDNYNCVDPPVAYTSWLEEVQLYLGHTYYIVVDGYSGDCGDYVLEVEEIYCGPECVIDCVGVPEGEPTCYDGYDDQYNGGCSSLTWSVIEASPDPIDICGTTGVFMYGSLTYRDTDWYLFYPCGGVPITATIESEVPIMLAFIDLRDWCYNPVIWSYVYGAVCEVVSISDYLPEGQFAVFVAPSDWDIDYECGSDYWLNLEGYTEHCDPTPVEATNWGRLKSLYR